MQLYSPACTPLPLTFPTKTLPPLPLAPRPPRAPVFPAPPCVTSRKKAKIVRPPTYPPFILVYCFLKTGSERTCPLQHFAFVNRIIPPFRVPRSPLLSLRSATAGGLSGCCSGCLPHAAGGQHLPRCFVGRCAGSSRSKGLSRPSPKCIRRQGTALLFTLQTCWCLRLSAKAMLKLDDRAQLHVCCGAPSLPQPSSQGRPPRGGQGGGARVSGPASWALHTDGLLFDCLHPNEIVPSSVHPLVWRATMLLLTCTSWRTSCCLQERRLARSFLQQRNGKSGRWRCGVAVGRPQFKGLPDALLGHCGCCTTIQKEHARRQSSARRKDWIAGAAGWRRHGHLPALPRSSLVHTLRRPAPSPASPHPHARTPSTVPQAGGRGQAAPRVALRGRGPRPARRRTLLPSGLCTGTMCWTGP